MKLRASYSLLSAWRKGQIDNAINSYLHLPTITSQAMDEGTKWDLKVQEFVKANKQLPPEFLGLPLNNPLCQVEQKVNYNELCYLKGIFDIYDSPILYEIKTGSSKDSGDYTVDFQVSMYLLMCDMLKLPIDRAMIIHYDQHTGKTDSSLIWKSDQELKRARNFIDTLVPEIVTYFEENGIFEREKLLLDEKAIK